MVARAFITGLAGPALTPEERTFLRETQPWGFILFKRNIQTPSQVADLVEQCRASINDPGAPVLIDQEGGRVQRLGPPHWPAYPPGGAYGKIYDSDATAGAAAARLGARLIAADLTALGIDVDCLPVADVPAAKADPVIGDRAYGANPSKVSALAKAAAEGLLAGGVLPVVKHMPGHGRANADSHHKLPVVGADRATLDVTDFAAFRPLANLPLGMSAHVVFTACDPHLPATTSRTMIDQVIRKSIGFDGLLMTDDISMEALKGSIGERTAAALAAGCDIVLHCNGKLDEMRQVAANAPLLTGKSAKRAASALAARRRPEPLDLPAARAEFARMMGRSETVARA